MKSLPYYQLNNISLTRHGQAILKNINLLIHKGDFILLSGASGAGKSSLLRLLNRLDDADGGMISVNGQPLELLDILKLRQRVGMLFQKAAVFPGTVADNLKRSRQFSEKASDDVQLIKVLQTVNLPESMLNEDMGVLSGGEQQRVALARVLLNRPEVLLLDEPTSALDPENSRIIFQLLSKLHDEENLTIIIVTHRLDEFNTIPHRHIEMKDGSIIAERSVE